MNKRLHKNSDFDHDQTDHQDSSTCQNEQNYENPALDSKNTKIDLSEVSYSSIFGLIIT
jgi:hypothetical protein